MITLILHIIAFIVHLISSVLLCLHAQNMVWLILNEILTCVSHAVGIAIWSQSDDKVAEYTRRWIEYAITAGFLEVALLSGNVPQTVAILTLNAVLQLYGWMLDKYKYKYLLLAGFTVLISEIIIISQWTEQPTRTIVLFAGLYAMFGIVQTLQQYNMLPYDEDHVYTVLSITTKIILTWSIVAHDWGDETLEYTTITCFGTILVLAAFILYDKSHLDNGYMNM